MGRDESNNRGDSDVLKSTWMKKRSQQKKSRFSFGHQKERWFVLTRDALLYYDGANKKAEKGRIALKDIRLIEAVALNTNNNSSSNDKQNVNNDCPAAFQVGYRERRRRGKAPGGAANAANGEAEMTLLYIQAKSSDERDEWMSLTRDLCKNNLALADKFHPGQWSRGWSCCKEADRNHPGCQSVQWLLPPQAAPAAAAAADPTNAAEDVADEGKEFDANAKLVMAVYPFTAIETGDLTLEKGQEYIVLDDTQEHWWQVQNKAGQVGFIPSNYVKEKDALGLQHYDWYVGEMNRQRSESLLKAEDKEGCFVVRNSSTKGLFTLSLYTKIPQSQVKHYHIKQNAKMQYYLSEKHCCATIPELMEYHSYNAGGLACRLKCSPGRSKPATAGLSHGKWEIDPTELTLLEELGSGQFGVVRRGKWKGTIDVAVKMMKEGTMSEDDFIEEAKVMTKLQHVNLVQLYGVCSKNRPIFIITEYMKHGSLLQYLRKRKSALINDVGSLLDFSAQVCRGMAYLERLNYIHRDLAARNCLVGSENVVKVADFGLARYVIDDQYTSNGGAKFPIKWSPPEVLNYTRFSSKSDVWAFGVLVWEIFTCGDMPYGRAKNPEVVERVQRGQVLQRPASCPYEIYEAMRLCWATNPEDRPSFRTLKEEFLGIAQSMQMD